MVEFSSPGDLKTAQALTKELQGLNKHLRETTKPSVLKAIGNLGLAAAAAVGGGVFYAIQKLASMSSGLTSILGAFVDILGAAVDALLLPYLKDLVGALKGMGTAAKDMVRFGKGGGDWGSDAGKSFMDTFASGVGTFLKALEEPMMRIFDFFVSLLKKTLPVILDFLGKMIGKMIHAFMPVLLGWMAGMVAALAIAITVGSFLGPAVGIAAFGAIAGPMSMAGAGIGLATMGGGGSF